MWALAKSSGWWWPFHGLAILTERPTRCLLRDGRLHATDGPALLYPDGFALWQIDGVAVDEQVVMRPETQTIEQIRREANLEVKRIRIERYGWPRYLDAIGATVVDRRRNDVEATKEALMRTPDGEVVLVAACPSTARTYCLQVPGEIDTCESAQAWLSGGLSTRIINAA